MYLIKILIVEDDPDWIKALTFFLNREEDICIIGSTSDKNTALQMVKTMDIDIVLMDIDLGENKYEGVIITEEISKTGKSRVIVLSSFTSRDIIAKSYAAGAQKFIHKTDYRELPNILRSAMMETNHMN